MAQHESEDNLDHAAQVLRIRQSPRHAGEHEKEAQQIGKARIGAVPRVLCLFVVVYGAEDGFGSEQ